MIWSVIWYWLLGIFTAADIITTKIALSIGMHEKSPTMSLMIDHLVELKFAFLLLTIGIIVLTERTKEGAGWTIPAAGAMVTFMAVTWNITQLAPALLTVP